jgi:DNA processing protein
MNAAATRACLALHRNPSLSSRNFYKLLNSVENPEQVFELSTSDMDSLELPKQVRVAIKTLADSCQKQQGEQDWALLQSLEIELVGIHSEAYPQLLKEIPDPPALLYVRGKTELLNTPQLAMVGSRRCSRQGAENAFQFARQLAEGGFTVSSGLALGIDAESHRGALEGGGNTIAVLGTGVNIVYPRRNAALYERMVEESLLISEFPLGAGPRPGNFPVRNRIISGMSLGVLVVEGAPQSGSLVTARCALEQGREVFAVPGSIHSQGSRGCHQLIRQGATLVETTGHIMEGLGGWMPNNKMDERHHCPIEGEEAALLKVMGYDPVTINTLQLRSGKTVAAVLSLLTTLELKGLVEVQGGCYQRLCLGR